MLSVSEDALSQRIIAISDRDLILAVLSKTMGWKAESGGGQGASTGECKSALNGYDTGQQNQ
jgi:hypothetical protein